MGGRREDSAALAAAVFNSEHLRWTGPLPDGTIAILHTHPNWLPLPSNIDARTARETKLPVYVITRSRISKTTGARGEVVLAGSWTTM